MKLLPSNPHPWTPEQREGHRILFTARGAVFAGDYAQLTSEGFHLALGHLCAKALEHGEAWIMVEGFCFTVARIDLINVPRLVC